MKPRSVSVIFLLAVFILSSLACNLSAPSAHMFEFYAVTVLPEESDGSDLNVEVIYTYANAADQVAVTCYYHSSSGTITINPSQTALVGEKTRSFSMDFPFSVAEPGDYQVYCTSSDGARSSNVSFRVKEAAAFSSGGLWFTYEDGTAGWCLPGVNYKDYGGVSSLDVAADGALSGKCTMSMYGPDNPINSTLAGTWDKTTGKISFHLTTVMTYNATVNKGTQNEESGTSTTIYEYESDGEMTSENQAGGDASYTLTCTTTNPKAVSCNPTTTGTVHWVINFNAP